ncbi:hypothetical protein Agub_g6602, partial [Astrephomene gubernaculifera]
QSSLGMARPHTRFKGCSSHCCGAQHLLNSPVHGLVSRSILCPSAHRTLVTTRSAVLEPDRQFHASSGTPTNHRTQPPPPPPPPSPPPPPPLHHPLLLSDIRVVLVAPKHPANIGAVARACANFECLDLVLVAPRCTDTGALQGAAVNGGGGDGDTAATSGSGGGGVGSEARKVACGDAVLDRMRV